ncbi:MAG: hypothetical protein WC989_07560 [Micavibrio sp.]
MSSVLKTKNTIHQLLEDTRFAYRVSSEMDHLNADYAEYASSQALAEFRRAFGDPELSHDQLCKILRSASNKERRRQCKTPWAMFMANFIERNGNSNIHISHTVTTR